MFELVISKYRKTQAPRSRMLWREIDAGNVDDGLPRGFLAGAT